MNETIRANTPMKKLLKKKSLREIPGKKKLSLAVRSKVYDFISHLSTDSEQDKRWLVQGSSYLTCSDILHQHGTLTAYEWNALELYFGKEVIRGRYRLAVREIHNVLKEALSIYFPKDPICVVISVQYGKFANVNVRLHMLRKGEFILDEDLDHYHQPVLYEILSG